MTKIFSFAFTIAIALCVIVPKCFGELPADIQKCHPGDVVCIAKTTTDILAKYPNGNKELGLRNLEPVHLEELVIGRKNANSPLSLDLKFTNLDMFGLSKANITRVVGFEKDPRKSKYEIHVTIPVLTMRGDYEANGRILLLPLVGKGKSEINFKNFRSAVKAKMTTIEKDGKLQIEVTKLKVKNNVDLMKVQMDGLFGGIRYWVKKLPT